MKEEIDKWIGPPQAWWLAEVLLSMDESPTCAHVPGCAAKPTYENYA